MVVSTAPAPVGSGSSSTLRPARFGYLDDARGLAIVLMAIDHVVLVAAGPDAVRMTLGRVAMPLFVVIAGALVRRLTFRHVLVLGVGLLLPTVVPWIDSPNILVLYVVAAAVIVALRRLGISPLVLVVVSLTLAANGYSGRLGTGFDVFAVAGLAGLGAYLGPERLRFLAVIPAGWFAGLGRFPLSFYVGHLLLLQLLASVGVFA